MLGIVIRFARGENVGKLVGRRTWTIRKTTFIDRVGIINQYRLNNTKTCLDFPKMHNNDITYSLSSSAFRSIS